ncbi:MAG: hypothetical protein B7Y43_18365 [Sphingomonas sp. 28-62-20]|uniref:DUF6946 family protein n=1 Tax=Sphingomonas sp. 28-62-20 TaxID=1970433 RepID=UPI000BD2EF67|nr:MAG: hypothetical protein B7Y43_18365 [Sphingomonas sp. 28-62-20]
MSKILVPSRGQDDWKRFLAQPDLHWKTGYSARTLAHSWEAAKTIPPEVAAIMSDAFGQPDLLFAVPEHKTLLPGGTRESQSDVLALVRHPGGLACYTIEGKVDEPFGPTVGEWSVDASPGKIERLAHLCSLLGMSECPSDVRYQLMHRTASALIEAERFDAKLAGMIVHSFSPERRWYAEFVRFAALLGCQIEPGRGATIKVPSGKSLVIGWATGDQAFRVA